MKTETLTVTKASTIYYHNYRVNEQSYTNPGATTVTALPASDWSSIIIGAQIIISGPIVLLHGNIPNDVTSQVSPGT